MLRNPVFSVTTVTAYLVLYYVLFYSGANEDIITAMFLAAPIPALWMIITILKYGQFKGRELKEDEEWGYGDKDKDSLDIF